MAWILSAPVAAARRPPPSVCGEDYGQGLYQGCYTARRPRPERLLLDRLAAGNVAGGSWDQGINKVVVRNGGPACLRQCGEPFGPRSFNRG
ncbi:hypothetical protein CORC01_13663 [Colletotrichum orchidophilum]|uniref:Uncharacterized protein n=1 Tax=Colletotrichum orchidophilum TaxID=1209926 RepID=A0A1G4APL9_9PEZI|nr:uncharacterized protein CORC01_13663 [Colletotrichum orchidophilum]OHE91041.1 hypothetical protein CORC01_13663 [Colletotrichum orchidophilum]